MNISLRHILVQPGVPPEDDDEEFECTYGAFEHYEMLYVLKDIAEEHARGVGVGTFRLLHEKEEYPLEEAKRDWQDLVDGGDGPWSLSLPDKA